MLKFRKYLAVLTLFIVSLGAIGTSAHARVISASTAGANAYTNNAQTIIYVKDTVCDNRFVSGKWQTTDGSSGTKKNNEGCNAPAQSALVSSGGVTNKAVQACRSRPFPQGMACSTWKY